MKIAAVQPMDLGDIVSAAWFLCVRHSPAIVPMALITFLATLASNVGIVPLLSRAQPATSGHQALPHWPQALTPLLAAGTLVLVLNQLALMRYSLGVWIEGKAGWLSAYRFALRSFLPVLAAILISSLVFALGAATWVGIPVALYFLVCWFFAGQVCLAEGETNPLRALSRSRAIVRGTWWRTGGVLLGITLLALLPSIAVGWIATGGLLTTLVLSAAATAVGAPFLAGAQTRLYLDLRIRKHESISLTPGGPAQPL